MMDVSKNQLNVKESNMDKLRSINRSIEKVFAIILECIVFTMFSMIGIMGIAALILLISIAVQTTIDLL